VYLAAILDALARQAITHRVQTEGIIHLSDSGVQYASEEYVRMLKENGFQISMGRKVNPYDNAKMENFYKTLKHEEVYLNECETIEDVWDSIRNFII